MYCNRCGVQLPDGSRFCSNCGQDLLITASRQTGGDPHRLPEGTILRGRYRVIKVLGQGGFGITYLGYDTLMQIQVAVKEYYPSGIVFRDCSQSLFVRCVNQQTEAQYQASKNRFLREAGALVRFRNIPEIVDILDFIEENNTAYIVMEYVQGVSLAKYVANRGGRLSADETFTILKPVMEALSQVHKADIVHRDIAPDNIILHPMGGAKLLDFGAVRQVENSDVNTPLTKSTEAILKHGFAPIEQYNSRGSLGPWTDCYALCGTIYYCLTGSVPPEASMRISEGAEPAWDSIPGLSQSQTAALKKGMAILAKDRYPNMESLLQALFAPERPTPQPQPQPQPKPQPAAQPQPQPAPQPKPQPAPQPKPQTKPQPKPQPKAQPAYQHQTGKSKVTFENILIVIGVLVGGFFACLAIYNTLFPPKAPTTTLGSGYELFAPEAASINLYDGTYTIRSSETQSQAEILDVWGHISGREIRETTPENISAFWQQTHDEPNISLYIWGGEFGKHLSIYVTPAGDMYFHSSAEDVTRYFTDCTEIYEALQGYLPQGDSSPMTAFLPDKEWTFLRLDVVGPDRTLLASADTYDPDQIQTFVSELSKLEVKYGGGLYSDFGGCTAQLLLSCGEDENYYITIYDDGSTNLEMGAWSYGIYEAVNLYETLLTAVQRINGQ